jgi:hypothetical protein
MKKQENAATPPRDLIIQAMQVKSAMKQDVFTGRSLFSN